MLLYTYRYPLGTYIYIYIYTYYYHIRNIIINILHYTHTHTHTQHRRDQCKRDKTRSPRVNHGVTGGGSEKESARFIRMALRLTPTPSPTPPPLHSSRSLGNFDWRPSPPTGSLTDRATRYPHPLPSTPDPLHGTPLPLPPPFVSVSRKNYFNIAYV